MYFVYLLQSKRTGEFYFGFTSDLNKRIKRHNLGVVKSTACATPWCYVYIEGYRSKEDAVAREKQLKHYGNARTYIKKRAQNSLLEINN